VLEALIGLAGVVIGAVLGGTGKYWSLRRDAWKAARASGLLLLADVRALCSAKSSDSVLVNTQLGATSWEAHGRSLAEFRQGNFPNGFRAPEWLMLASHFARLEQLSAERPAGSAGEWWAQAQAELAAAESLLRRFEDDPPVLGYVVRAAIGAKQPDRPDARE